MRDRTRQFPWPAAALIGLLCAAGCATVAPVATTRPVVKQDGYTLDAALWTHDAANIRRRAAFEFNCPAKSLRLEVLAIGLYPLRQDIALRRAKEVGVEACGRRGVYVYLDNDGAWVMNTKSTK